MELKTSLSLLLKFRSLFFIILCVVVGACSSTTTISQSKCLENHGALDIGSGSSKILVAEVDICLKKISKVLFQDSKSIKIKESLTKENLIPESMLSLSISTLKAWKTKNKSLNVKVFKGVATEVFRQTQNGSQFIKDLSKATQIPIRIIDQTEEANLGFWSAIALSQKDPNQVTVWDIGGGSMQITMKSEKQFAYYRGQLASVSFKNMVLEFIGSKSQSPNPLKDKNAVKALESAVTFAKQNIPESFVLELKDKELLGIGGVHNKSILKQVNAQASSYNQQDIEKQIKIKQNLSDKMLAGDYPETEVTNLILVLGFMKVMNKNKVEVVPADLTYGLILN